MRTVIDLRDEASPSEPFALPSPASVGDAGLREEPNAVCIALRELELLMTFPQFVAFTNALNAWRFRGCGCGRTGCGELDMNHDHGLDHEHEVLRGLVRAIADDNLGVEVPPAVSEAVQGRLREWRGATKAWRSVADRLREAEARIVELEADLAASRKRKAR